MPVGPAGLSGYHAAQPAADAPGPRLGGLQPVDGSVMLEGASLIVAGDVPLALAVLWPVRVPI